MANVNINTKILSKKLRFGEQKCHQLHVGKPSNLCPDLKVNDIKEQANMVKVQSDTYLGEIIADTGNNQNKVKHITSKGTGLSSSIMAILNEISFGFHYFKIATLFRESIFINRMLWNTETWYNWIETEVNDVEKIDRMFLKRIMCVPSSTPSPFLYLELGITPLRYIIQARRLT